jgi:hypothetical protein
MAPDARTWVDRLSEALGVGRLTEEEVAALLEVAGTAAHASERTAAPLTCWLAAKAGLSAAEALAAARDLESALGHASA